MKFDVVIAGGRVGGRRHGPAARGEGRCPGVLVLDKGRYQHRHALDPRPDARRRHATPSLGFAAGAQGICRHTTIRSTTFSYQEKAFKSRSPIEPKFGVSALYAPRRALLNLEVVANAAANTSAEFEYRLRRPGCVCSTRAVARAGGRRPEGRPHPGAHCRQSRHRRRRPLFDDCSTSRRGPTWSRAGTATGVLYSYWEDLPVDGYYWRFRTGREHRRHSHQRRRDVRVRVGAVRTLSRARFAVTRSSAYRRLHSRGVAGVRRRGSTRHAEWSLYVGSAGRSASSSAAPGPGGRSSATPAISRIHSPLTASRTHCAILNCWRARLCKGQRPHLQTTIRTRHDLSRRLFDITDDIASFACTDDDVQSLHRAFSTEMSREVRALDASEPLTCRLPSASEPHVAYSHGGTRPQIRGDFWRP